MSDEELIARLRDKNCCETSCNCDEAADCIEEYACAFANLQREYDARGERIEVLVKDRDEAEQRGYANAMEAERKLHEAALAAIARHLAPGDELVAQATAALEPLAKLADDMDLHATDEWDESELLYDTKSLITALLARISALTAHNADLAAQNRDATKAIARMRDRLARMEGAGRDAAEDWEECLAHVLTILGEKPDWYDHEAQAIAYFRAALTDGGSE
jgi:chromosome segregation ATPase